jgi:hypothetical protein
MSLLARPGVLAAVLVLTALVLHPAVGTAEWLPGRDTALAALLLLTTAALALRAVAATRSSRLGASLLAAGLALVVAGVAGDGLRGHRGSLSLEPGQARGHFDEVGPHGRSLGLRPLGFTIGLEEAGPGRGVTLQLSSGPPGPIVLRPDEAIERDGVRLARPRIVPTGQASRLTIGISGGGQDTSVVLTPGRPSRAGDLTLALEQYFPDFALDDQRRPFTRSTELRNPGALLVVDSPQGTFRVFVLRAMPGVHRVEQLDRSFALLDVEPAFSAEIAVHREPFAGLVLLGALLALAGVVLDRRPA